MPSYFYLVQKKNGEFRAFCSDVTAVERDLPRSAQALVPRYYADTGMASEMKSWLQLSGFKALRGTELDKLYVDSSGMPVRRALDRSMMSLAVVFRGDPTPSR